MAKFDEEAEILEQQCVAAGTYRLRLASPRIVAHGRAGQFVLVRVAAGSDPLLRRPFSFHRLFPSEDAVEILYKVVGRGTLLLSRCRPGTRLSLLGPLGNGFTLPPDTNQALALAAGGIGIAPLLALVDQALAVGWRSERLHLFYGARNVEELLPPESLTDMGIQVHWSTDDGSYGCRGTVIDTVRLAFDQGFRPARLYGCGTLAMQYHLARLAADFGVDTELSLESLMACGLGACLGCALPARHSDDPDGDHYVHVCKDGPIFSPGSIRWQKIQFHRAQSPIFLSS